MLHTGFPTFSKTFLGKMTDQKQPLSIEIDTDYRNEVRFKADDRTDFLLRSKRQKVDRPR